LPTQGYIFHPDALHAAEAYITNEWQQQGYEVRKQVYTVQGIDCANLEESGKSQSIAS
jgi:hypothetical protein